MALFIQCYLICMGKTVIRPVFLIAAIGLVLAGCTFLATRDLNANYGAPSSDRIELEVGDSGISYDREIRPILEKRCVVCHACYDAPCQLKMESYGGITRGLSNESVYNGYRLIEAPLTRLNQDAHSVEEWRKMGFSPALNERMNSPEANLNAGLLSRMLKLKKDNPLPETKRLPPSFDLSLNRTQQCPKIETFEDFAEANPLWGMPYGLPNLPENEYDKLQAWLAQGAGAGREKSILDKETKARISDWESFLNGDTKKQQLASRYLYEHLYLAHLYFEDKGQATNYFELVRSKTPPGEAVDRISTRRPFGNPKVKRVYYRLIQDSESKVAKTHMPYVLDQDKRNKWQEWFFDADYSVEKLPSYEADVASNPFISFQAIPPVSRYKFLLDEAQFTIMNFIKGPVCRGSVALDVIQDRFWVFFIAPEMQSAPAFADFLAQQDKHLRMPAQSGSAVWSIAHWREYAKAQQKYLHAKGEFISEHHDVLKQASLGAIWDGDGVNQNAALSILRHNDSATVVKGLLGEPSKTTWIIDYPILERIHYLLVAGFDVYGTVSHQAMTRMYMDFLRMESEMNFLAFMPEETRTQEVENWYRGAVGEVDDYLSAYYDHDTTEPLYESNGSNPKLEFYNALKIHMQPVLGKNYAIRYSPLPASAKLALEKINTMQGVAASIIPQTTLISIKDFGLFTLSNESAYKNIASMFHEESRRLPAEDRATIVSGILGAYPNVFLEMEVDQVSDFVGVLLKLKNSQDYIAMLDKFAVRRTSDRFWSLSDEVHEQYQKQEPLRSGILDYNRLDNL